MDTHDFKSIVIELVKANEWHMLARFVSKGLEPLESETIQANNFASRIDRLLKLKDQLLALERVDNSEDLNLQWNDLAESIQEFIDEFVLDSGLTFSSQFCEEYYHIIEKYSPLKNVVSQEKRFLM